MSAAPAMFNDSSMDSAIMASPQQGQVLNAPPSQMHLAKFPPIKSSPDRSKVAVVYSNEYSAKKSMDELFDLENLEKRRQSQKSWRQRNMPGTFFDQASASSSTSHSRDSLDSPNILTSPKRLPMSSDGVNHLSLKRNLKMKPENPMQFDSKTRSLPFSFSPSNFDPNLLVQNATLIQNNSNLNHAAGSSKVQLESFSQLQQGLLSQNRIKASDHGGKAVTSVVAIEPSLLFGNNPCQQPAHLVGQTVLGGAMPQQQVLTSQTTHNQLPFGSGSSLQYHNNHHSSVHDQSKDELHRHGLQQLENERAHMRKRQLELVQAKLIGLSAPGQRPHNSHSESYAQPGFQLQQVYDPLLSGHNVLNKPQSRPESIDSGLDLIYSSSTESTNRVSPELFTQHGVGPASISATQQLHLGKPMHTPQQEAFSNNQFGLSLNHKMVTSGAPVATVAGALFASGTSADIVAQAMGDNLAISGLHFGRVKSNTVSSPDGTNSYMQFPANNNTSNAFGLLDEYDNMSIASSPSTLDTNGNNNQESHRAAMDTSPYGQKELNSLPSGSSMYDDNFISNFLNSTESSDLLDFGNANFGLSGHGIGGDGCDLATGFSYNL